MTETILVPSKLGPWFYLKVLTGLMIVYTCFLNSSNRGAIKVPLNEDRWLGI